MTELLAFQKWAADIGHYRVVEAVDRYLKMLAADKKPDKSK